MNNKIIAFINHLKMNFPLTVMIKYYAMENVTMMNRCHHFAYFVMKELYI